MTRSRFDYPRETVLASLLLAASCAFVTSAASAETVDEIVAANIAASGGDAIARIDNFASTGSVAVGIPGLGDLQGTIEAVSAPGRGYYENVHIGPIYQQQGWDGEQAWQRGPAGRRVLAGYEAAQLAMQSFANTFVALEQLSPAGLKIEQLDEAEIDGRPQEVLKVSTDGGAPSTLYLDRETHLLSRSVTRPNPDEPPVVVDIGDYEAHAGVMMPTSISIAIEGTSNTRVKLDSIVFNTSVDESKFTMPGD